MSDNIAKDAWGYYYLELGVPFVLLIISIVLAPFYRPIIFGLYFASILINYWIAAREGVEPDNGFWTCVLSGIIVSAEPAIIWILGFWLLGYGLTLGIIAPIAFILITIVLHYSHTKIVHRRSLAV